MLILPTRGLPYTPYLKMLFSFYRVTPTNIEI